MVQSLTWAHLAMVSGQAREEGKDAASQGACADSEGQLIQLLVKNTEQVFVVAGSAGVGHNMSSGFVGAQADLHCSWGISSAMNQCLCVWGLCQRKTMAAGGLGKDLQMRPHASCLQARHFTCMTDRRLMT